MDTLLTSLAMVFGKGVNWIIVASAVINMIVFWGTRKAIKKAYDAFFPQSDKVNRVNANMQWDNKQIQALKKVRKGLIQKYAWYANITAIFPLLGILGTVAALVTYSVETMMENFMVALSTTLLGVFCAILFKGIDAIISGPMDVIIADADYVIQEHERKGASE